MSVSLPFALPSKQVGAAPTVGAGGAASAAAVHVGLVAVLGAVVTERCGAAAAGADLVLAVAANVAGLVIAARDTDAAAAVHVGLGAVLHKVAANRRCA